MKRLFFAVIIFCLISPLVIAGEDYKSSSSNSEIADTLIHRFDTFLDKYQKYIDNGTLLIRLDKELFDGLTDRQRRLYDTDPKEREGNENQDNSLFPFWESLSPEQQNVAISINKIKREITNKSKIIEEERQELLGYADPLVKILIRTGNDYKAEEIMTRVKKLIKLNIEVGAIYQKMKDRIYEKKIKELGRD